MANDINTWHPKEEKTVHALISGLVGFAILGVSVFLILTFVPSVNAALLLVQALLHNMISLSLTAFGLAAIVWLGVQTFSPKGKINGLFAQAYSSFIHNLTVEMMNVDPMSPLKDSLAEVRAKKAEYDQQFAKFDGAISTFKAREKDFRDKAAKAERQAAAAQQQGNVEAFKRFAYEHGTEIETADNIAQMRARLEPVREIIVRLQSYAGDLIWKLGIDIDNTQATWEMANSMTAMEKAARGITADGGKSGLALEAQKIVQTKYATAIGRLENLNDLAKPLLDSADLDKATFSQDLLAKWQAEERGSPLQITAQATPVLALSAAPAGSAFTNLIR